MYDNYNYICNLILIGDSAVGKSSIMAKYLNDPLESDSNFDSDPNAKCNTIGVDFQSKNVIRLGRNIKLNIFDACGSERMQPLVLKYLPSVNSVMLVFDMTNITSCYKIEHHLSKIYEFVNQSNCKILIVGNKSDLVQNLNPYQLSQINKTIDNIIRKYNVDYISVSAKTGVNIDNAFQQAINIKQPVILPLDHYTINSTSDLSPKRTCHYCHLL